MNSDVIETPFGRLAGRHDGATLSFRRVRYAPPPLGESRWRVPGAPPSWSGVISATESGPVAPQAPSRLAYVMGDYPAPQDEDCLHLDIWCPADIARPAPVLVFFHGGAFMTGGGSMSCYDGSALAARTGLIVVNVSYRLGALGFMAIDGVAPANLGLHDQVAALRWIRQAIGSFGGDPTRVTVIGQSAGAYTIALLCAHPMGRELFRRAVLLSAPLGLPPLDTDEQAALARDFLAALGLSQDRPDALRAALIDQILAAQRAVLRRPSTTPGGVTPPFMTALDGDLVHEPPLAALARGAASWCETIIGWTREENMAFAVADEALVTNASEVAERVFATRFGVDGPALLRRFLAARAPSTPLAALTDLLGNETFVDGSLAYAAAQAANGQAPFVYRFDWQPPKSRFGACHCIELPFLFGDFARWRGAPMLGDADPAETQALGRTFQDAIAAFAREGTPNAPCLPVWPAYVNGGAIMHFDRLVGATC